VGKQTIDAGPRRGRIEQKLSLAILLHHSVVVPHHNRSICLAAGDNPEPKYAVVDQKRQNDQRRPTPNNPDHTLSEFLAKIHGFLQNHRPRLYGPATNRQDEIAPWPTQS